MRSIRIGLALLLLTLLSASAGLCAQEPGTPSPLSLEQVVDNLIRMNRERADALLRSEATRTYHLIYRGFPSDREAEMVVQATFKSPASKEFQVISEKGSKLVLERVFRKLLEGEKEAAQPQISAHTQLNHENYDFELVAYEAAATPDGQYILKVIPKSKSKYVYRGQIWVDGADFAVTRIEAEPAQNPSFWTKKSVIRHEYGKFDGFWLPVHNESVSYIRLGGQATLTIDYGDYHVTDARRQSTSYPGPALQKAAVAASTCTQKPVCAE